MYLFKGQSLSTTVHRKPTDKNIILTADSYHPLPPKRGLPVSQSHRLSRICDTEEEYDRQSNSLLEYFRLRGYPDTWLD